MPQGMAVTMIYAVNNSKSTQLACAVREFIGFCTWTPWWRDRLRGGLRQWLCLHFSMFSQLCPDLWVSVIPRLASLLRQSGSIVLLGFTFDYHYVQEKNHHFWSLAPKSRDPSSLRSPHPAPWLASVTFTVAKGVPSADRCGPEFRNQSPVWEMVTVRCTQNYGLCEKEEGKWILGRHLQYSSYGEIRLSQNEKIAQVKRTVSHRYGRSDTSQKLGFSKENLRGGIPDKKLLS